MTPDLRPLPVIYDGRTYALCTAADPQEPLARDLDLAAWLGYERPRDIRKLIERHADALGVCATVAQTSGPDGGRPTEVYLLREDQVLYLVAKSETPRASELLKMMIQVFIAARRGLLQPGLDRESLKAELLADLAPLVVAAVKDRAATDNRRTAKELRQLALKLDPQPVPPTWPPAPQLPRQPCGQSLAAPWRPTAAPGRSTARSATTRWRPGPRCAGWARSWPGCRPRIRSGRSAHPPRC
jgi:hypothetical protein